MNPILSVKRNFSNALKAVAVCTLLCFASCNKEADIVLKKQPISVPSGATMSQEQANLITGELQGFYTTMKSHKAGGIRSLSKTTSGKMYTVDSATYLIEGSFNLLAVSKQENKEEEVVSFKIMEPLSAGNLISEENVANAFWRTHDTLMEVYKAIAFAEKALDFLELQATIQGGNVTFTVTGKIIRGAYNGNTCVPLSNTYPSNRAFAATGQGAATTINIPGFFSYYYGKGQGNFSGTSVVSKSYSSVNPNSPDAPTLIRQYGKAKYSNCFAVVQCGYYTNITSVSEIPVQSTSDGLTASNPGSVVFGTNMWITRIDYPNTGQFASPDDSLYDAKTWLSTAVVDFFIDQVPGIITANLPAGKTMYDFNISTQRCVCAPQADPLIDITGNTYGYQIVKHSYTVTSAVFVPSCGGAVGLEYM